MLPGNAAIRELVVALIRRMAISPARPMTASNAGIIVFITADRGFGSGGRSLSRKFTINP